MPWQPKEAQSILICTNRTTASRLRAVMTLVHLLDCIQSAWSQCFVSWYRQRCWETGTSSAGDHWAGWGQKHLPYKERLREMDAWSLDKSWIASGTPGSSLPAPMRTWLRRQQCKAGGRETSESREANWNQSSSNLMQGKTCGSHHQAMAWAAWRGCSLQSWNFSRPNGITPEQTALITQLALLSAGGWIR